MNFFGTIHCDSEAHCKTCRNTILGEQWRDDIQAAFDDVKERDFECPKGKPWKKTIITRVDGKVLFDGRECKPCSDKETT